MSRQRSPTDDLGDLRLVFSDQAAFTTPERAVLAVLILRRNGESGRCDPSLSRIADEAGIGRRTAMRVLESLDAAGVLKRKRARDGRTRTSYSLKLPTRARVTLGPQGHQGQGDTGLGSERHQTRATVAPERTKRTNEGTNEDSSGGDANAPHVEEAIESESVKSDDASESMKTNTLVAEWINRQTARPPTAAVQKQGAAAKRLVAAYSRPDLESALEGIGRLFPHSNGEPWDLFDLERKFAKATVAPARNGNAGGLPAEVDHEDLESWRTP